MNNALLANGLASKPGRKYEQKHIERVGGVKQTPVRLLESSNLVVIMSKNNVNLLNTITNGLYV